MIIGKLVLQFYIDANRMEIGNQTKRTKGRKKKHATLSNVHDITHMASLTQRCFFMCARFVCKATKSIRRTELIEKKENLIDLNETFGLFGNRSCNSVRLDCHGLNNKTMVLGLKFMRLRQKCSFIKNMYGLNIHIQNEMRCLVFCLLFVLCQLSLVFSNAHFLADDLLFSLQHKFQSVNCSSENALEIATIWKMSNKKCVPLQRGQKDATRSDHFILFSWFLLQINYIQLSLPCRYVITADRITHSTHVSCGWAVELFALGAAS